MNQEIIGKQEPGVEELNPLQYNELQTCPKCSSYFLDINCESCGYILDIEDVSGHLEKKSFYVCKEEFIDSFPTLVKFIPSMESFYRKEQKKFLSKVWLRLKSLIQFIAKDDFKEGTTSYKTMYAVEINDCMRELLLYGKERNQLESFISKSLLDQRLKRVRAREIEKEIFQQLDTLKIEKKYNYSFKDFMNYKIFGGPRVSFIVFLFLWAGCFSALAFYFLKRIISY